MSTNPFRKQHKELTDDQKQAVSQVKNDAECLYATICDLSERIEDKGNIDPRCLAVAKTKLEEAVMWAVKGFTN